MSRIIDWLFAPADEHRRISWLFFRAIGLVYLAAFASLAVQIGGLAGSEGLLPFGVHLEQVSGQLGATAFWHLPNIFWLNSSDSVLTGAAWAGCVFAAALLFNLLPRLSLIALFVLYLSLFHAGQMFMNFQWDYLLLETGFLAILLAFNGNRLVIWLFHWLLFRLRFESGASKLLSGDASWADFSALLYYFETQPLPHWGAWFAHQLPEWLLRSGAGFVLIAELLVPFLMFLPRRLRLFAAWVTLLTQLLILLTSNHNFFNLLTMVLCLFLFDDRAIDRVPGRKREASAGARPSRSYRVIAGTAAAVIIAGSSALMVEMISGRELPDGLSRAIGHVRAFGLAHRYHVFPTIRTERLEVVLEGSVDGTQWSPYRFRYKPQALDRRPAFVVPHQPRLDWMMWFVTLDLPMNAPWLDSLVQGLFANVPAITGLLAGNPFATDPPRMIRGRVYRYRFSTPAERQATGDWWTRELLGPLVPFPWYNLAPPARQPSQFMPDAPAA